jgi:predicted lipoprotein
MKSRAIKYAILIGAIAFLGYNSVYFKKLDEVQPTSAIVAFDADRYARELFTSRLISRADTAIELSTLIALLSSDPSAAFEKYSNASAVGNLRYFLVKGEGTINSIAENSASIQLSGRLANTHVDIATEFVYGNSIRDASGLVRLSDFTNTVDFNNISEGINKIVRKEVLPPFLAEARPGRSIRFAGAVELNRKYLDIDTIEVVPIKLTITE